ncbi:MAG: tetratricopeptide repeat protein [Acidobacteriota bacterium]|nr:tetratricopeptide repeat protein [Acidobacteriota bacterium]
MLIAAVWLIVLASGTELFVSAQTPAPTPQVNGTRELLPARIIEREMTGAETHRYKFDLKANEFFQVRVEQKGVDVALELLDAEGKTMATMDSPNAAEGFETLSFAADKAGAFLLEVGGFDEKAEKGFYTISRIASRNATEADKRRVEVERLFVEALTARNTEGQSEIAVKKLEESLQGWRELKDEYLIDLTAFQINQLKEQAQKKSDEPDGRELKIGETVERPLKGGETHFYTVELKKGQVLRIDVQAKGVDLNILLFRAADEQDIARADFGSGFDREVLTNIIEQTGIYVVVISAPKSALSGNYQMNDSLKKSAAAADAEQIKAETLLAQGLKNRTQGTAENLREAVGNWEEALPIWKKLGEKYWEAHTANFLGLIYSDLGEKQKALEFYNLALPLYKFIADKNGEATTLSNTGAVYSNLGEKQKALEFYNLALPLNKLIGDKSGEATTLNNIGLIYSDLGENQKALEFFNLALPLNKLIGDKQDEAGSLNNIGGTYSDLGENQKALEFFNLALSLYKIVGDQSGEATTLNNIGKIYSDLGENQKALEFFDLALPLRKLVGNKSGEATTLSTIAAAYSNLGEKQKALEFYNLALPLYKIVGGKSGEAATLGNIGAVYGALGENQKALEFYNLALPLYKIVGDKSGEAATLSNTGAVYYDLGENQKALEFFNRALPLYKIVGGKPGEATTLSNLMSLWNKLGNRKLAAFYGKQSVNIYQQLRSNIEGLDKSQQKSYLKSIEFIYRYLADVLIADGRLGEAQQVLDLFKDQQFFDFNRDSNKPIKQIVETPRENEFALKYRQMSEQIGKYATALDELKTKIGTRQPGADEKAELEKLENDLKSATENFLDVFKQAAAEFSKPSDVKDNIGVVPDTADLQATLRNLSRQTGQQTVAIYTLVGADNFRALIVSPDGIKAVSTPVESSVLNEQAKQYWLLLQSDKYDPTILSKQIYETVFKPLETQLPKDTKTILWSLDGNLRYIPMAALFDGKQYLVERFNHVNFTRADSERMTRAVNPNWTALGLGSSAAHTVDLLGEQVSFSSLPGTNEELAEIMKQNGKRGGIFDGQLLQDAGFTKPAMLAELKQHRPLVHIASHFAFRAGDEARSFLLLGDGTALTLDEMKRQPDLFSGVDLLTLSACNTAATQADANGREVDGFAELAQRLGAGAVLASLWSVADESTAILMSDFYRNRKEKAGITKAEAMRQAQLELLYGKYKPEQINERNRSDAVRFGASAKNMPKFVKDENAPFAHPFYWSPFVLIGNWR